jgi:HSP20 family protein
MALIRFRPFSQELSNDLTDIHTQVNRLFDGFLGQPIERVWAPTADMYETKNQFVVSTELPGLSEKDIQLSLADDVLTIQGERQWTDDAQEASRHRRERWFGKFERSFSLPAPVDAGQVKATYRDGVLTVNLPKAEENKPKEIKIEAA